jgi:acetylornithine deacetylase/succinyl-diaminopimelate desuccinylase-like protein
MEKRETMLLKVDEEEIIRLTSDLIKIRSISHEPPYEKEVAIYLADYWRKLGLEVSMKEVEKNRPNVIGKLRGEGEGPTLMFEGHQDTNMPGTGWTHDPFGGEIDREGGWIYGLGSVNMKQSLAAYTAAIHTIINSGVKLRGHILLAATVKELIDYAGAKFMIESGIKPDICILGEPTCSDIQIAHSGSFKFEITTKGTLLHISTVYSPPEIFPFEKKINAIYKALDLIAKMREVGIEKILNFKEHAIVGNPVFIIGHIQGGHPEKPAFYAQECKVAGDIRYVPGMTVEGIQRDLEKFIRQSTEQDPSLEVELVARPENARTMPMEISPNEYVVKALINAHRCAFRNQPVVGARFPHKYHQNESSLWVNLARVPTPNYGAGGSEGVTRPDERISISELVNITKAYGFVALDICTKTKEEVQMKH